MGSFFLPFSLFSSISTSKTKLLRDNLELFAKSAFYHHREKTGIIMPTAAPPPAFPAHSLPPPARRQPWLPSRLRPHRTLGGQLSSCHCPARGRVSQAPRGGGLEAGRGLGSSGSAGQLLGRRGPASPCAVMGALLPFPPLPQPWWEDRGPLEGVLSQGRSPLPSDPGQGASCSPVSSAASVPSPVRQNCRLLLKLQQWRLHRPARPPPPAGSTPDSVPAAPCGPPASSPSMPRVPRVSTVRRPRHCRPLKTQL